MSWEKSYLNLITEILLTGSDRVDRTGVGTRAIFAKQLDIDLSQGFPAMTTKKLAWKAVVGELLWFLEGSSDERRLAEITHGTRDPSKTTIWTDNAQAEYWKPKAIFDGDLGRVYGVQWRSWRQYKRDREAEQLSGSEVPLYYEAEPNDQIANLIHTLRTNPTDRRMIVSAWNVGEISEMALPPCHMFMQFFVDDGRRLSCKMTQRSVDAMLGLPFNIASYALLVHMIAQVTNLIPHRLIMDLGDCHIYSNHIDGALQQLTRKEFAEPKLVLNPDVKNIDDFKMSDISLEGYESHPAIKLEMAV